MYDIFVLQDNWPSTPFKPNFDGGKYMREYQALMTVVGVDKQNGGIDINPKEFRCGNMFLGYDSGPDACNSYHTHNSITKGGFIGAEFSFNKPLDKPIKLIVYSVYHNVIKIDSERNVTLEYVK